MSRFSNASSKSGAVRVVAVVMAVEEEPVACAGVVPKELAGAAVAVVAGDGAAPPKEKAGAVEGAAFAGAGAAPPKEKAGAGAGAVEGAAVAGVGAAPPKLKVGAGVGTAVAVAAAGAGVALPKENAGAGPAAGLEAFPVEGAAAAPPRFPNVKVMAIQRRFKFLPLSYSALL